MQIELRKPEDTAAKNDDIARTAGCPFLLSLASAPVPNGMGIIRFILIPMFRT